MKSYAEMSDLELVGHVGAIPDASEISQVLARRVELLTEEKDEMREALVKLKQQLMSLELGLALDKVAAYDDLVPNETR